MTAMALLLALALGASLAVLAIEVLINREDVAAGLVLLMVVLNITVDGSALALFISDIRLTPSDLGFTLLAAAAMARYLRLRRFAPAQRALAALAILLLMSLARGALEVVPSAFNDFRSYFGFAAAALYFSTAPTDQATRERIGRVWLWAGWVLAIVISLRWAGRVSGVDLGVFDDTYDAAIRVLSGPPTFMVATIALIALLPGIEGGERRTWERRLGILLLLMAIGLNRRTVWLTLLVALVALVLRNPAVGRRVAAAAVVGIVAFTFAVPYLTGSTGDDQPAAQTATDTGTFLWRIEGWAGLLSTGPSRPVEITLGQPFGRGYVREISGRELESTPHSYYVQTYLRTGLLGLGTLLLAMWLALVAVARRQSGEGGLLTRNTLFLLLLSQGVWFLTWNPGPEQGIVLGLAIAFARDDHMRLRPPGRQLLDMDLPPQA